MGLAIFAGTTARSMTYQTINSLRRSRRKSHIPFYRSSHLSKSKSITGAGATNGYRMFSTWYPSAIDDHWNARLEYKASCIIAFALLLQNVMLQGALETTNNLYNCVYLYIYVTRAYIEQIGMCLEYTRIYSIEFITLHVGEQAKSQKYVN